MRVVVTTFLPFTFRPSNDAFASVVRSFGEANSRFQALVVQLVGRAVEIQSHDDWIENVHYLISSEGVLVGRQEWDSGGPGAGAGTLNVYLFRGIFISDNDIRELRRRRYGSLLRT